MSDSDEETGATKTVQPSRIGVDTSFIRKPSGYILIINMILAFVSMCLISGWLGSGGSGSLSFFAYATTHTWVALLVILILQFLKVPSCCSIFNWNLTYLINAVVFVVLLLIGSILALIKFISVIDECSLYNCGLLAVATVFGIITMLGCLFECRLHYTDWRNE